MLNETCQKGGMEFEVLRYYGPEGRYTPLVEQGYAVARGDIMVGVHGGGLGLQPFTPKGSVLLELHLHSRGNWHFHNIAHFLGNGYVAVDVSNMADEAVVREGLESAVALWKSLK